MRALWGPIAVAIGACSAFGSANEDDEPEAPGARYDAAGVIPCEDRTCNPPGYCCARNFAPSTCEADAPCAGSGEARVRCADSRSCSAGNVCCMRLDGHGVTSVECEPDAACVSRPETSGTLRLCGDGDSHGVCPGACLAVTRIIGANTNPPLDLRACE